MPTAGGTSSAVSGRQSRVETVAETSWSRHPPIANRPLVQSSVCIPTRTRGLAFLPKAAPLPADYADDVRRLDKQTHVRSASTCLFPITAMDVSEVRDPYLTSIARLVPKMVDFVIKAN